MHHLIGDLVRPFVGRIISIISPVKKSAVKLERKPVIDLTDNQRNYISSTLIVLVCVCWDPKSTRMMWCDTSKV